MTAVVNCAWVSADLTAWHTDPFMSEGRHSHTWVVTVFWPVTPWRDGRVMRQALSTILAAWEGRDLPPELWSQESLAATILALMGNGDVRGVRVERADFPSGCELWR